MTINLLTYNDVWETSYVSQVDNNVSETLAI